MGTSKKRQSRTLEPYSMEWAMIMMLTGEAGWSEADRQYVAELWERHGEKLTQELRDAGEAPPLYLAEVDKPRYDALMNEWRERHWPHLKDRG